MKTSRKEIKIAASIHDMLVREAGVWGLTLREYTEAVIQYFASRRLNPKTVQEGLAWGLHEALDKGIERIMGMLGQQDEEKLGALLVSLREILHEQINARILLEILLNNLHQLSRLDQEELQQLVRKNSQFARQRKASILKVYKEEVSDQTP
ncbi:hypothetical protein [Cesiribacter andamanensis]|uniref:Uncharacterized protein n=1 Tax=Cesiribacter andamanensis AMV16 TaxID=1279009 RepID=M7NKL0_9BACT|nr:hypothetical protein [Cesiribacter andamanensis]EMR02300.1 hypothetical protein ADICEAN_02572 [Cesiribacter andamanensis AMV16]